MRADAFLLITMATCCAQASDLSTLRSFLNFHCTECHADGAKEGRFELAQLGANLDDRASFAKWERVHDRLAAGEMPPKEALPPPEGARTQFLTALAAQLKTVHAARKGTVMRRLNRAEYENTLNDLLGVRVSVKELLPEDALTQSFDNVAESLSVSAVHMQRYLEAAELALAAAIQLGPRPEFKQQLHRFTEGKQVEHIGRHWRQLPDGAVAFFNSGGFPAIEIQAARIVEPGYYRIRLTGYAFQTEQPVAFKFVAGSFARGAAGDVREVLELPAGVSATVEVITWFDRNDRWRLQPDLKQVGPRVDPEQNKNPGLAIQHVEVEGPLIDQWPPRGTRLLFGDLPIKDVSRGADRQKRNYQAAYAVQSSEPEADSRRLLQQFAAAAFRRPVSVDQAAPYVALCHAELRGGLSFVEAMRTAAVAVLTAPDFLYRREAPGRIDDDALASRLSYWLARTAPDEWLLELAAAKQLSDGESLKRATERLLEAPTSQRFVADFTDGWLNLRDLEFTTPDRLLYPEFDEWLQMAMLQETRSFFTELLQRDLSVANLIDSEFAMVNGRLARHYGIDGVAGTAMRRVPLPPGSHRGGILTQAAVLKVSANGTNTSPVVRGAYVLERLLGVTPPVPPPGIPGVEPDIRGSQTIREQLDKHRSDATCASCHKLIDPPGFALESYDVIGGWRERYRSLGQGEKAPGPVRYRLGPAVNASGELVGGRPFANFEQFQKLLRDDPTPVVRCLTSKLLTFATGREMGFSDRAEIDLIAKDVMRRGGGLRSLIHAVAESEIFQTK